MTPNEIIKHEQTLHRMWRDIDLDAWRHDEQVIEVLDSIAKAKAHLAEMRRRMNIPPPPPGFVEK